MGDAHLEATLRAALSEVERERTAASLKFFCGQLECFDLFYENKGPTEKRLLKAWGIKAGQVVNCINSLKKDPNMLRIYQIVAKHSTNMRETGIYDQLEATRYFSDCLKFHVLWAESWAKAKNVQKFREIVELARTRVKGYNTSEIEDSFRDFVTNYFPNENHIFTTDNLEEDTAMIFSKPKMRANRRRSSVAFIQQKAKLENKPVQAISTFETGGKTKIRKCFIDREDYFGVSPEEFREALLKDRVDMDDDMDITVMQPSVEQPVYTVSSDSSTSEVKGSERKKVFGMSCVSEESEQSLSHEDKRRRLCSPNQKTSESVFAKQQKNIIPEETQLSASSSLYYPKHKPPSGVTISTQKTVIKAPSATKITRVADDSFADGSYFENINKAAALFSDTVNLDRPPLEDQTMPLVNDQVEKIDVYMDETSMLPSQTSNSPPKAPSPTRVPLRPVSNPVPDFNDCGDATLEIEKKPCPFKITDEDMEELENFHIPPRKPQTAAFDDEITVAGFRSHRLEYGQGIVTSTPAHFMNRPPTHADFFAVEANNEMEEDDDEDEDVAAQGALGFMKRRNSLAPKAVATMVADAKPKTPIGGLSNSMNMALENINLGSDDDELNQTGVGRPTEAISGDINPWDANVRQSIMDNGHYITPIEQHDYTSTCAKVQKNKVMVFGGERFHVQDLVGEGGFAKVFRCVNEEKQTLALKYEIPPSTWEVYVCEQVNRRLRQSSGPYAKIVEEYSVMKVTDAYIFSNASILLNEFHTHGTLLDVANKMKDPSWLIILFIAINIARILREAHNVEIIHGDAKPDNFMVLGPIPEYDGVDSVLNHNLVKLIDWGRAIDMKHMNGATFKGRGGTDKFDCPEMLDGRPWTYQTDFFNFVSTITVIALGKYVNVRKARSGRYEMQESMKRRLIIRDLMTEIFDRMINAPSCDKLPDWDAEIELMTNFFRKNFNIIEWRNAVTKFNQSLP